MENNYSKLSDDELKAEIATWEGTNRVIANACRKELASRQVPAEPVEKVEKPVERVLKKISKKKD